MGVIGELRRCCHRRISLLNLTAVTAAGNLRIDKLMKAD